MNNSAQLAMDVDKVTFEKEQTDLVKFLLNERFFKPWENYNDCEINTLSPEAHLEIFITSTCNQSCEYCYLYNNPSIYPPEFNKKETILKNLDILCNWIIHRGFWIPKVECYTGEIWHSNYGLEVLEILYQSLSKVQWTDYITIPSNCSFVRDEIQLSKIQRYINKFRRLGISLCFSISVDGAVLENYMRPLNDAKEKTNEFYERLFLFAKHNNYYFHPMVAAKSVHQWIENAKWWMNMCEKYDMDFDVVTMMLEVRNADWSDEDIKDYCNFLDFLIESYKTRKCNGDTTEFFKHLTGLKDNNDGMSGYVPFALAQADTFAGCTVSNNLTVRLGDMAICPCHRTAYNKFLYGKFKIENDQIVDIIGNNPQMAIRVLMANNSYATLNCDVCAYNGVCLKGCFGSQYETTGDPFYPIDNICKFFKQKYYFLVKKYVDMGILEFLDSYSPYYIHYPLIQWQKKIIKGVLSNEPEAI